MGALPAGGAMLAVAIGESEARESIQGKEGEIAIAAINSPTSLVLSGAEEAIGAAAAAWEAGGKQARRLAVSHAFHSPLIEPMLEQFAEIARGLDYREPQTPIVSSRTGEILSAAEATDPSYWVAQAREPVRFAEAVSSLQAQGATTFLEIGPEPVLCAMAEQTLEAQGARAAVIPTLRESRPEPQALATALAQAYACGAELDWQAFFKGAAAKRVSLPTYPFQRERYWLSAGYGNLSDPSAIGQTPTGHPLLGAAIEDPEGGGLTLTGRLSRSTHPWLADHLALEAPLLPGAALLELALHAAELLGAEQVAELTAQAPLLVPERSAVQLQVTVSGPDEEGQRQISIHSRPEGSEDELAGAPAWRCNASGRLGAEPPTALEPLGDWPPEGAEPLDVDSLYDRLADLGLEPGPALPGLGAAWRGGDEVFAEVSIAEAQRDEAGRLGIHPALVETAPASEGVLGEEEQELSLPSSWSGVALQGSRAPELRLRLRREGEATAFELWDPDGAPLGRIGSLRRRPLSAEEIGAGRREETLFGIEWTEVSLTGRDAAPPDVELMRCETAGAGSSKAARKPAQTAPEALQRWSAAEPKADSRLALITQGAMVTADEEVPDSAATAIWGLVRSAQSENPGRFVLIDSDGSEASTAALPAALGQTEEPQLALRAGAALAPRLVRLPDAQRREDEAPVFDPDRTVLLTGATGGLGALIARHLVVENGARRLLLVSRSGPEAEGAEELQAELEELGAKVRIAACDVSQRNALAALLDSLPAEHPLGAVIHAAGALADATIERLGEEDLERGFATKADAALHLPELSRGAELSGLLALSSARATLRQ